MDRDAPGMGGGVLHPCKLLGRGGTALAAKIVTRATPDSRHGLDWTDLLLAVSDSLVCTNALVLVWFHPMAHTVDFTVDNNALVRRLCVVVLSTV